MFEEVWSRSFCRTIEKLVEVVQEYPTEVEHIYSPSCVPLVRCAGCCGDEKLECHPTTTTNVTMQVSETQALSNITIKGPDPLVDQAERPRRNLQSCEDRSQSCTSAKEAFSLSFPSQTGKKVHFLPQCD